MVTNIIVHELKNIITGSKFFIIFLVASVLLLLSTIAGINQYQKAMRLYETTTQLVRQEMREARGWTALNTKILRKPQPMDIFVSGVNNDIGRISGISTFNGIKLTHSTFSDDPVYAVFRFIDFAFIISAVFSLFAILFTFDSINGESERGTLQVTFANPIPRSTYIIGKFAGSWVGLVVPLSIPMLLSLLCIRLWNIPFSADDWLKVISLFGAGILYITFFIAMGIFLSTLTKRSSVSFLFSLVLWVCLVFIIPRAGTTIAGQIIPVPTEAEVESRRDTFSKDRWSQYEAVMVEKWKARNAPTQSMNKEMREAFRDAHMWEWMEEDDHDRKLVQKDIDDFSLKVHEDLRNKKAEQQQLAFLLSRFSPASAFQLAAMNMAGTDIGLKTRYEDALNAYRPLFISYKEKKQKENGDVGGIRIEMNTDTGLKINAGREKGVLDLSDMPAFTVPDYPFHAAFESTLIDISIISFSTILAFAGAFIRFLWYDLR